MITAFLIGALALVIGFIMGANAAKSKIMHDIEMGLLYSELEAAIRREIGAQEQEQKQEQKQEQRDYQSNGRTVNGTFHRME